MISAKPMAVVAVLIIGGAVVAGLRQTGRAWIAVPPSLGEHRVRDTGFFHGQVSPTPSSLGGSREKPVQESVVRSEFETGSQLQGTVRGGDEGPVPSADVWIEMLVNGALDRVAACRGNERGAFILDLSFISGMTPAEFQEANPTLCAWGLGHALERDELGDLVDLRNFLREQEGEPWDIELEWGGDVFGRVVDRGGRPVPGAVVRSSWGSTVTDVRGTYRFGKTGVEGFEVWEECDFEARKFPGGAAIIESYPVGKFGSTRGISRGYGV